MSTQNKNELSDLYVKYNRLVSNICKKQEALFKEEGLEDLCQYCWERIVEQYDSFDPARGNIIGWIRAVSKNTLINLFYKKMALKRNGQYINIDYDSNENINNDREV